MFVCVLSVGLLLKDCLALGPPQSVQLSRCPNNDFHIDRKEREGGKERAGKTAVERKWKQVQFFFKVNTKHILLRLL